MFKKFFKKPSIKGILIKKGGVDLVKLKIRNSSDQLTMVILISIIKQIAERLGIDYRALLNKLLKLDSTIKREQKKVEKVIKYGNKK